MSWKDILKSELKNTIDTWAQGQADPSGPLTIIFDANKEGPHSALSNIYFVNNQQQFEELRNLYSQAGKKIVDRPLDNAFFVK